MLHKQVLAVTTELLLLSFDAHMRSTGSCVSHSSFTMLPQDMNPYKRARTAHCSCERLTMP
jgi:hypothetical protein